MEIPLTIDNRQPEMICHSCGQVHSGILDMVQDAPFQFRAADEHERKHFQINSDLCRNNQSGDCFIRAVLPIPVHETQSVFCYGIWTTLSEDNFQTYVNTCNEGQGQLGPWFGWFASDLNGYPETLNLKSRVYPQPNGKRPYVELEPTDHPLALEQRNGISTSRIFELFKANGHDLTLPSG